jgi:hypothetical protein
MGRLTFRRPAAAVTLIAVEPPERRVAQPDRGYFSGLRGSQERKESPAKPGALS